jgi:glycosyltransferase involved in cell wall biosynthesis
VKVICYFSPYGIGAPWVANELSRLEAAGVPFVLHALRRPVEVLHASEWATSINRRTAGIYPLSVLNALVSLIAAPVIFRGRFWAALGNALFGKREHLIARLSGIGHLFVACAWTREARKRSHEIAHIHSQWIHASGTVAMYSAWLLGVPFSFTGHASDLFRERCALEDKIRRADFIVCISEFHRRFYLANGARADQLVVAYCGIDQSWFYPRPGMRAPSRPYRILSSGRLVEKKGMAYLIEACRILADRGTDFECVIAGSGELEGKLRAQAERLGLSRRVTVTGKPLIQERIVDFMHGGDVYVLACVWAKDGDVDGLPQMLMEAMACGLPAVSTRLVGIPDLIRHEETGLLAEPNDAAGLADAIERLMRDPGLAARLAEAGRCWVAERFDLSNSLAPLIERYRRRLGIVAPGPQSCKAAVEAQALGSDEKAAA